MKSREWNAAAYHRVSQPQFEWGVRVLERLAMRGDERALDAGCGTGRLTAELRRLVSRGHIVATDLSEQMARAARQTLTSDASPARTDVVCADLLLLPFAAEFDLIFSTATFHWVLDHDRLWAELHRVLVPGGSLEAQCGGGANLREVHSRATQLTASAPFARYFESWRQPWEFATAEITEARLRRAGFSDVRCWMEAAPTTFDGAEAYRTFMKTVVMRPYLARLPEVTLQDLLLDRMTAMAAGDPSPYMLDYWRLNIHAVRP